MIHVPTARMATPRHANPPPPARWPYVPAALVAFVVVLQCGGLTVLVGGALALAAGWQAVTGAVLR